MATPAQPQPTEQQRDSSATPPANTIATQPVHPCEARTKDHRVCNKYVATVLIDGEWRCPSHRPRKKAPGNATEGGPASPPPVTSLKSPRDALRLSSWAAVEMAA